MQKPTGLTSDHFNFHIKRLVRLSFVSKVSRGKYKLTPKGKEYANRLDTGKNTVERQPKVAVLLNVERKTKKGREFFFQQRLKNPYYGFWGLPTGKITWGEKIEEAAARELMEETGLTASWVIKGVYHELADIEGTSEIMEDKIFFVCQGINVKGKLIADFEGGHNEWLTRSEVKSKDKIFPNTDLELGFVDVDNWLHEHQLGYSLKDF